MGASVGAAVVGARVGRSVGGGVATGGASGSTGAEVGAGVGASVGDSVGAEVGAAVGQQSGSAPVVHVQVPVVLSHVPPPQQLFGQGRFGAIGAEGGCVGFGQQVERFWNPCGVSAHEQMPFA